MIPRPVLAALGLVLPALLAASCILPAGAQDYDRPPPGFGDDAGPYDRAPSRDRSDPGDAGALAVRMSRMEGRIRELTGQIEELQNANRKLIEQLQKFQGDVDARLSAAPQRHSEAAPALRQAEGARSVETAPAADGGASKDAPKPRRSRRDDAFNPDAAGADAPGRPKPLGSTASGQGDAGPAGGGPVDLSGGRYRNEGPDSDAMAPTLRLAPPRQGSVAPASPSAASPNPAVASSNPGTVPPATGPRAEFDAALGLYRDKQYEDAEKGFAAFLARNPKSRLAADATYYLGESYAQRGRSREAAEQYLKVSTDYGSSPRAPDAMLHLGMSLKAIGAKEQACATFSEVTRKYPNAPTYVRNGAEREAKRAQC